MLPYLADYFGLVITQEDGGTPICRMPASDAVLGRPGFMHGGAIATLLEFAAYAAIAHALSDDEQAEAKPIGVSVEFLRSGNMVETWAAGRLLRIGGRIANVSADAWQDDSQRPIASAQMTFSLRR